MSEFPNITRGRRQEHVLYCTQPQGGWLGDMARDTWGNPGDVRRCVHGRLMLGVSRLGSAAAYWSDLSPIFNPILWYRARVALRAVPTGEDGLARRADGRVS